MAIHIDKNCLVPGGPVNTYRLGQSVKLHSSKTIKEIAERLLLLKKRKYRIVNLATYLEEILRFHNKKPSRFLCKGGEIVFYIDWLGDVYPCFIKNRLFNILKDKQPRFLENIGCNDCLTDCFREPSLMAYTTSPRLVLKEIEYNFPIKETIL